MAPIREIAGEPTTKPSDEARKGYHWFYHRRLNRWIEKPDTVPPGHSLTYYVGRGWRVRKQNPPPKRRSHAGSRSEDETSPTKVIRKDNVPSKETRPRTKLPRRGGRTKLPPPIEVSLSSLESLGSVSSASETASDYSPSGSYSETYSYSESQSPPPPIRRERTNSRASPRRSFVEVGGRREQRRGRREVAPEPVYDSRRVSRRSRRSSDLDAQMDRFESIYNNFQSEVRKLTGVNHSEQQTGPPDKKAVFETDPSFREVSPNPFRF